MMKGCFIRGCIFQHELMHSMAHCEYVCVSPTQSLRPPADYIVSPQPQDDKRKRPRVLSVYNFMDHTSQLTSSELLAQPLHGVLRPNAHFLLLSKNGVGFGMLYRFFSVHLEHTLEKIFHLFSLLLKLPQLIKIGTDLQFCIFGWVAIAFLIVLIENQ